MPLDPRALLRSRNYLQLLVLAAILGVPVSAAAYGFLALVSGLQQEVFTHLPHGGMAMSHLPGLPLVADVAMGMGAMCAVMPQQGF